MARVETGIASQLPLPYFKLSLILKPLRRKSLKQEGGGRGAASKVIGTDEAASTAGTQPAAPVRMWSVRVILSEARAARTLPTPHTLALTQPPPHSGDHPSPSQGYSIIPCSFLD